MKTNFKKSLTYVLFHEGRWSDNPKDPGGATMKGVTLTTYRYYFGKNKTKEDLFNITDDELGKIYYSGYWSKCCCDDIPTGIDYPVFDAAVNSGPSRSAKWLQSAVECKQDGYIGPKTLNNIKLFDPIKVIDIVCDERLNFLRSLSTWHTFGKGWGLRVQSVRETAYTMVWQDNVV